MKKKIISVALLIAVIFMVGCRNNSTTENLGSFTPTSLMNNSDCNTEDKVEEYSQTEENKLSTNAINDEIYNLKSVSVFITSKNENMNEIKSLSISYISLKLESDANIGTDLIKRESLRPRKITNFGEIFKISYNKENPVMANDIRLIAKVILSDSEESSERTLEKVVELKIENINDIPSLVGELVIEENSGLKFVFEAEIECVAN